MAFPSYSLYSSDKGRKGLERRLAAILAADVVGYTTLMGADEAGTLQRFTDLRRKIIEPLIKAHHGRIVKLMGDGLLVEFASVVDAVACARAWQDSVSTREAATEDDKRLKFRIGINLGDVIVEGDDIHGDGVNIASRLEGLAEPGGICLSGDAYRQVRGKTEASFEDLGEQNLRNVKEPVRVYRVTGPGGGTAGAAPTRDDLSFPDKPSIAVLPFTNMSGDPEQEFFADGLAEDIITELSREPHLLVIARNSSFVYKGKTKSIKETGRDLGVRYVLEGAVRKAGDRIRLTTQLIDTETNSHLWAERYDRALEDIFEVQDELTSAIYSTLLKRFVDIELQRTIRQRPRDLDAYELVLRGTGLINRGTRADLDMAFEALQAAIALDPGYGRAHAMLAWAHMYRAFLGQADDYTHALEMGRSEAQKAIDADRNDYWSHGALGSAELYLGHHERALPAIGRAIELAPCSADMRAVKAIALNYLGRPEEALADVELAIRLNPHHPDWYLVASARAL
jgi:adenylate cyclase